MSAALKPYVADESLIVLSFPMLDHGGLFAHWLRDKLMKHYNLYSVNAVYCDCVASRHQPSFVAEGGKPFSDEQKKLYDAGHSAISLDERAQWTGHGYNPIGARNKDWDTNFRKAMSQAKAMIFILTDDYIASTWCLQEWNQFHDENRARAGKRPLLRGVVLDFVDKASLKGQNQSHITVMPVSKVYGLGGLLWQTKTIDGKAGAYGIGEGEFAKLVDVMGAIN